MLLNIPLIGPVIQGKSYPTLASLLANEHLAIVEELPVYLNAGGGFLLIPKSIFLSLHV